MKTVMITAGSSNQGKTTITLGLLRALKNRGLDLAPYKTGPDYIDSKYLELAAGNTSGNLDIYMMGRSGIEDALSLNGREYGLVEGAMGYFDGIYNTYENSSYDIGNQLDIPAILVYQPKGEMFSAVTKIKGMVDFSKGRIKGVIFNKCSPKMAEMLTGPVKEYVGIEVLGYVPKDERLEIESRHLGLLQPSEIENIEEQIDYISRKIEETVDIDSLIEYMEEVQLVELEEIPKMKLKIGIAYDEAFSFYYSENIRLLDGLAELVYFSPLRDKELPEDLDLIYMAGGYPELYKEELAANKNLLEDIRDYAARDGHILAEGAGLMYLAESIDEYPMLGIIDGRVKMTDRTQKFGYTKMEFLKDTSFGKKSESLKGKEFHRSLINTKAEEIFRVTKPRNPREWKCGYSLKNVFAFYGHINFLGNRDILMRYLDRINREKIDKEGC